MLGSTPCLRQIVGPGVHATLAGGRIPRPRVAGAPAFETLGNDHSAKLQCFAARAERLRRTEQARILRLLIERIDVAPDGISVMLHAAGIRSLVAELAGQEAPALAASEPLLEAAE